MHTINANFASFGDVHYTLVNSGLPNNGLSFGLTSSWANGQSSYYFDNLWFVGNLTEAALGTVRIMVPNGLYLGDPNGSLRMDSYGDPIGLTGTLTRIIPGQSGLAGAVGAPGPQGPIGLTGLAGAVPAGTVIFLVSGTPAPAGYTRIGTFTEKMKTGDGDRNDREVRITFVAYRKN